MKNIVFIVLAVLFIGCNQTNGVMVTFDDERSNAVRAHYQNYLNNDLEGLKSLWSPALKIYLNNTEASGIADIAALITAQHENFDNISMHFGEEGQEDLGVWVQSITYPPNAGYPETTYTQTWFTWSATGKASGETIEIPVHIGFEWADGKIIQEWHHFDPAKMMAELALAETAAE